jgi:DivIVA domain-containing protein
VRTAFDSATADVDDRADRLIRPCQEGRGVTVAGQPPRFTRTWFRPGYSIAEVDHLVARITATLGQGWQAAPPVTAEEVRTAVFRSGRLRAGYHQREVDEALDGYEEQLRKAEAW